jgi:hypothetical protein
MLDRVVCAPRHHRVSVLKLKLFIPSSCSIEEWADIEAMLARKHYPHDIDEVGRVRVWRSDVVTFSYPRY